MTSAVSVPASAGVPVTQRGIVHAFTVVSGHLPPGHEKSQVDWAALARSGATLSVIMGVRNAGAIADALLAGGLAATTPVAIIENGTIDEERVFKTTLASMGEKTAEAQIVPPAVFVIGEVADLR